jgi:cleavage and polyadenylation specificity factor subunit 1
VWRTDRLDIPLRLSADDHHRPRTSVFESQLFNSLARLCGIQLSWTTAHHLTSNGLLERFHRTLKAAIMCHADQSWTEALPLVLLGIRAAFKEDLQVSVAELVYGEPLRIPGELLTPTAEPADPVHLITELRRHVARLRQVPAAHHASPATFVHSDLGKCTHAFLCQDAPCRALEPPYSGPYWVLSRRNKTLQLLVREDSSLCQLTGSSQPTCSVKRTAEATTSTHQLS